MVDALAKESIGYGIDFDVTSDSPAKVIPLPPPLSNNTTRTLPAFTDRIVKDCLIKINSTESDLYLQLSDLPDCIREAFDQKTNVIDWSRYSCRTKTIHCSINI